MKITVFIFCCFALCSLQQKISEWEMFTSSMEHMDTIKRMPPIFKDLSMVDQATYADPITKKYALVREFALRGLIGFPVPNENLPLPRMCKPLKTEINRTSIANLAYMAIHSEFKDGYKKIYDMLVPKWRLCYEPEDDAINDEL
jgi:hypothetical protein